MLKNAVSTQLYKRVDASLQIICNVRMVNGVACTIDRELDDASVCSANVDCFLC